MNAITPIPTHLTRESWLVAAADAVRPWFDDAGSPLTAPIRVTIGFPSRAALSLKRRRIGECWSVDASSDGTAEICVSPLLDDPLEVVAVLVHEMGHAALGMKVGHRKPFARLMEKLSLEGPATGTVAGDEFRERAAPVLEALGPLPHARLNILGALSKRKPDTCRQLKVCCPACGYIARVSQKWLSDAGPPMCPTDAVRMKADEPVDLAD
jgi:hypothetical protein